MKKILFYGAMMCALGMMLGACTEKENVNGTTTDSTPAEPTDTIPTPTEGEWIDLGLPSGLLWASCNVGANTPTQYGNYYAWGETQPKNVYNYGTYVYCNGFNYILTKYNSNPGRGTVDSLTTLEPMDDAATVNLGNGARTPTYYDWLELTANCTMKYIYYNNNGEDYDYISYIHGHLFIGPNGNSIFLPCAGWRKGDGWGDYRNGGQGYYWSASTYEGQGTPGDVWAFLTNVDLERRMLTFGRAWGLSVRAVRPQ